EEDVSFVSLAEGRSSNSSFLSLEYHTDSVSLFEEEADYGGRGPDTALEQFSLCSFVESNVRIEDNHDIGNPLRLCLVNDQSTMPRGSFPIDPLRIVPRNISSHTVEVHSRSKGPGRNRPGPRT